MSSRRIDHEPHHLVAQTQRSLWNPVPNAAGYDKDRVGRDLSKGALA